MNFDLLKAIKEKGLSQKDFAYLAKDHPSVVSRVISGKQQISRHKQLRYAKALRQRPEDLFRDK